MTAIKYKNDHTMLAPSPVSWHISNLPDRGFVHVIILTLAALLLAVYLSAANATEANQLYLDVPNSYTYAEDIVYLAENGIVNGTGNQKFLPENDITCTQLCFMLSRAFGDNEGDSNAVSECFRRGWVDTLYIEAPSSQVCRGAFYDAVFKASKTTVYLNDGISYASMLDAAQGFGLCGEDAAYLDYMTRGEAAYVIHQLMVNTYTQERPPLAELIRLNAESRNQSTVNRVLKEAGKVPQSILDNFYNQGWSLTVCSSSVLRQNLGELDSSIYPRNFNYTGLTRPASQDILVCNSACVVHEFGHFLHDWINYSSVVDTYYEQEGAAAARVIRRYTNINSREFFADVFDYYITNRQSETALARLKNAAPQIFSYMETLEANDWCRVS